MTESERERLLRSIDYLYCTPIIKETKLLLKHNLLIQPTLSTYKILFSPQDTRNLAFVAFLAGIVHIIQTFSKYRTYLQKERARIPSIETTRRILTYVNAEIHKLPTNPIPTIHLEAYGLHHYHDECWDCDNSIYTISPTGTIIYQPLLPCTCE